MKIVIAGYSGTGKTTLAKQLAEEHDIPLFHCDELKQKPRQEQIQQIAKWLDEPTYIIEGVMASHGLREWRKQHPNQQPPCDEIHFLQTPKRQQTTKQKNQSKGIKTVQLQIRNWSMPITNYEESAPAFPTRKLWSLK